MKDTLIRIFTWWNGATLGTLLHTKRNGEFVGEDEFGNRYFRTKGNKTDPALGVVRRWVIYNGEAEPSKIPPGWYGWIHHKFDEPPQSEGYVPREWEKPHRMNPTGTPNAYRPKGSILNSEERRKATGDYQPWTPGN